jgi:UDP-N-acetylmuramoylalanine--D-glutamate ligase
LDYFDNLSHDWFGYTEIKIKDAGLNIFLNKKILIYGLGKSGLSTFNFLKKKADIYLYDDFQTKIKNLDIKKKLIRKKNISNINFDQIILSPGIDLNKCKLSKFLKKNYSKIFTDLDVFYSFYKNDCITITGTNGKSTTCQLMYEVLLNQKIDVRVVGNIGNPILSTKNIKKKTIFVVEASSYQLEYSKIFRSKYAAILNLSPDHIERHKTLNKYIKAKFKLLQNQLKGQFAFVKKDDLLIKKYIKFKKFNSKIIKINTKRFENFFNVKENIYFSSETNKENLSFVIEISKKLRLKKNLLIETIRNFNGLKYRQQIIFRKKYLTIINDSKSTTFSSSMGVLKANNNIYWLLGGVHKKGDKFNLPKKYFNNIKAFIYGKNKNFFNKKLKGKIECKNFDSLKNALTNVLKIIKKEKTIYKTILFSPCAASFDSFKNFEDRGFYFNKLINKYLNGK